MSNESMRIAKWLARAGYCSRREAERWIEKGRVSVDGKTIESPALVIDDPGRIKVDGKPFKQIAAPRIWLYHKPVGLLTTHDDPEGRPTVFENLPKDLPRVISVGRLDLNSEGLLLLTNDGETARYFEHPDNKLRRIYRVKAFGTLSQDALRQIRQGLKTPDMHYLPAKITIVSEKNRQTWLRFELVEGKNREIRNILEHFNLRVLKLIREEYGPFKLGDLPLGQVKEVPNPAKFLPK